MTAKRKKATKAEDAGRRTQNDDAAEEKAPTDETLADEAPKTVTCRHCRYEYPAHLDHCSICGYPWPWLKRK